MPKKRKLHLEDHYHTLKRYEGLPRRDEVKAQNKYFIHTFFKPDFHSFLHLLANPEYKIIIKNMDLKSQKRIGRLAANTLIEIGKVDMNIRDMTFSAEVLANKGQEAEIVRHRLMRILIQFKNRCHAIIDEILLPTSSGFSPKGS
ncbi:MAG: hypothetical protein Q8P05_03715 [Candidatus Diapherotrites archaeon]|nr:hypothetical protein [Candidatus Diapherotrites archaeon]